MITLTTEEALIILQNLSRIDGFLFGVTGSAEISIELELPCEIIANKLKEIGRNNEE